MTATMTRTPMAIPSMKRRKPGSQEKDGRALIVVRVSCMTKVNDKKVLLKLEMLKLGVD